MVNRTPGKKFWIIIGNIAGNKPFQHSSRALAEAEVSRLTSASPNVVFTILEAMSENVSVVITSTREFKSELS